MESNEIKVKNRSALGNDPFEDMESWNWPDINEVAASNHKQVQPALSTKLAAKSDDETGRTEASTPDLDFGQPVPDESEPDAFDEKISGNVLEVDPTEVKSISKRATPPFLHDIIAAIDAEIKQGFGAVPLDLHGTSSIRRDQNEQQFIVFTVAGANYAASIANVSEVGSLTNYTFVPNVPNWLVGVTNLRGDILSAVDLGAFLGLEPPEDVETVWASLMTGKEREMLVVHLSQNKSLLTIGLLVDEVQDIRYLNLNQLNAPTIDTMDTIKPYLRGIYDDDGEFLVVLDFDKLLLSPQMQQFEPV